MKTETTTPETTPETKYVSEVDSLVESVRSLTDRVQKLEVKKVKTETVNFVSDGNNAKIVELTQALAFQTQEFEEFSVRAGEKIEALEAIIYA